MLPLKEQRAKKEVSDSPGVVDFALMHEWILLQMGKWSHLGNSNYKRIVLLSKKFWGASWNDSWSDSISYLQLTRMASCKTDFLCTLLYVLLILFHVFFLLLVSEVQNNVAFRRQQLKSLYYLPHTYIKNWFRVLDLP